MMSWWGGESAPILWARSFAILWNPLVVSRAGKEIPFSLQASVATCTSYLKTRLDIVIICLRNITPLNINNFWGGKFIRVTSISWMNISQLVNKPSNGKNNQYSETDSPICHDRCWTIWTNVNCIVECHSFSVCWFGMAYPHGVTMWRIKHLFGLALPHIENMKWIIWFQRRHIWRPKMTQWDTSTIICKYSKVYAAIFVILSLV